MKLFDSHSHIDDTCFEADFNQMMERARQAGVERIMIAGINAGTSEKAIRIAEKNPGVVTSVGVHPHDVKFCDHTTIDTLKRLAENPCVRAWGEIGLDFNRMFSPADVQETRFEEQLEAASSLGLPLIFHERDSNGRFLEILESWRGRNLSGVVHCFSGNRDDLVSYLDLGYFIGITGIVTIQQRGAELRDLVRLIPDNRILIETDAPYLTPAPQKNKNRRNEPAFVKSVLLKLAEVRDQDPEYLAQIIWTSTCSLFSVSDSSPGTPA